MMYMVQDIWKNTSSRSGESLPKMSVSVWNYQFCFAVVFQINLFVDTYLLHQSLTLQDIREIFFDEDLQVRSMKWEAIVLYIIYTRTYMVIFTGTTNKPSANCFSRCRIFTY